MSLWCWMQYVSWLERATVSSFILQNKQMPIKRLPKRFMPKLPLIKVAPSDRRWFYEQKFQIHPKKPYNLRCI